MATYQRTPAWMGTLIALFVFGGIAAFGYWLYYYQESTTIKEEWHRKRLLRTELRGQIPILDSEILILQKTIPTINAYIKDIENDKIPDLNNGITELANQSKIHVTNIKDRIAQIRDKRTKLFEDAIQARNDLAKEETRWHLNAASYDQTLSEERLKVQKMAYAIEKKQENFLAAELSLERDNTRLNKRVQELINRKNVNEREMLSDGRITAARADDGYVVLNIGWRDNLRPGTKFTIFNRRAGKKVRKGEIEVVRVDTRISHARILSETYKNDPVVVGDHLHNPIYDPKEIKTFVIKGHFANYSHPELIRFIKDAGGSIEKEITTGTHYLVAGENADEYLNQANNYGVIILSERKLLEFILEPTDQKRL